MQINKNGAWGFLVEHIEFDRCVKFQVNRVTMWWTWPFQNYIFERELQRHHLASCGRISWEAFAHHFQLLYEVSYF